MPTLSKQYIATLKNAAKKLTGAKGRAFEAQVTVDYFDAKAYLAEQAIGWGRKTIALGLNESRTGIVCVDNFKARGNQKTAVKKPQLKVGIIALAEPQSQTDPKFQTLFKYTRTTAKAMRIALMAEKGWQDKDLPRAKSKAP